MRALACHGIAGSFRCIEEFTGAVRALADGVDVTPLMSGSYRLEQAEEAFALAADRARAAEVQLDLAAEA